MQKGPKAEIKRIKNLPPTTIYLNKDMTKSEYDQKLTTEFLKEQ